MLCRELETIAAQLNGRRVNGHPLGLDEIGSLEAALRDLAGRVAAIEGIPMPGELRETDTLSDIRALCSWPRGAVGGRGDPAPRVVLVLRPDNRP